MESLDSDCTELKKKYDTCFTTWYTEKFLKGNIEPECKNEFERYQACLQKTLKERGIHALIEEVRGQSRS